MLHLSSIIYPDSRSTSSIVIEKGCLIMRKRFFAVCGLCVCLAAALTGCDGQVTTETDIKTEAQIDKQSGAEEVPKTDTKPADSAGSDVKPTDSVNPDVIPPEGAAESEGGAAESTDVYAGLTQEEAFNKAMSVPGPAAGSGSEILSVTQGKTAEGEDAWVIKVAPVQSSEDETETAVYYVSASNCDLEYETTHP
jgi:hypothetical protein